MYERTHSGQRLPGFEQLGGFAPPAGAASTPHSALGRDGLFSGQQGLAWLNADSRGRCPCIGGLGFEGRFVDQHDGNVVLDSIDAVTLGALQAFWILAILERVLAGGTNQDFEEIFGKHDESIVRRIKAFHPVSANNSES